MENNSTLSSFFFGNRRNVSLLSPCLQHGRKQAEVKVTDAFAPERRGRRKKEEEEEEGAQRAGVWCHPLILGSVFSLSAGHLDTDYNPGRRLHLSSSGVRIKSSNQ